MGQQIIYALFFATGTYENELGGRPAMATLPYNTRPVSRGVTGRRVLTIRTPPTTMRPETKRNELISHQNFQFVYIFSNLPFVD